jgi:type I restriction enzyme S subunit
MTRIGSLADTKLIDWDVDASIYVSLALLRPNKSIDGRYLFTFTKSKMFVKAVEDRALLWAVPKKINMGDIAHVPILLPVSRHEQSAIASVVLDAEKNIQTLERLIAKKQAIKQGMMQQLLSGRTRLPGFGDEWVEQSLGDAAIILDNLRVPLSAAQRAGRTGPFPYCGANGVLDYIDSYMIDDDVVLLAEDGGNFDQWRTRPIAYRMSGKIWVNNHAHVLKAESRGDTGFLFYALEHKDITPFISSGTRSKLTRAELVRIKVQMPASPDEQSAIASVLANVDRTIAVLGERLTKAREIKTGMMQQLLTGLTRLPVETAS